MNILTPPFCNRLWAIIGMLMLLVLGATLTGNINLKQSREEPAAELQKSALSAKPPVDLSLLAERMRSGVQYLTQEQLREEAGIRNQQVRAAESSLEAIDTDERLAGAEQLAAYPTREAEALLNKTLQTDTEKEVRQAAAVSLGYVKQPKTETINFLLISLQDPAEEVRSAALETLTRYFARHERDSNRVRQIIKGLKNTARSKLTPPDTRQDIRDWLQEQSVN